jgi:hypothetical protein
LEDLPQHGPPSAHFSAENKHKAKMLEEIASSRFGFWIVALIMAAVDASFLLKPGKFAFSITRANQVRLRISSSPFTIRNRELASSFLSFPFQLFFISDIDALERTARETFTALSRMRRLSRQTMIISVLSAIAMVLLILGPCAAGLFGVQKSILVFFLPLYGLAMATSALLWRRRRRFGFSNSKALKISAEIILCPVLLVNISKRISLAQKSELNTFRLASLSRSPVQTMAAIRENIRFHNGD